MNAWWISGLVCLAQLLPGQAPLEILPEPPQVRLEGPQARYTLLVNGKGADGRLQDLTRRVTYRTLDPKVATVRPDGLLQAVGDGKALVEVEWQGREKSINVEVIGSTGPRAFHF